MARVFVVVQGMVLLLASVLVVVLFPLTLLAVWLAKWDKTPTPGTYDPHPVIRGDVPKWLRWLQTNDERLPGGLHEPTVARVYEKYGRVLCSWYWIGWRNRAHGLRMVFAHESSREAAEVRFPRIDGRAYGTRPDGTWFWSRDVWRLRVVTGHRIYQLPGRFVAVPAFTIKMASEDSR